MSTYDTTYQLRQLMDDFKTCATAAGFCSVKFGPESAVNFDHNICYDLLNIDYPTSHIAEGIDEIYSFKMILARPFSKATTQGVQIFDDEVIDIFSALELKMWNLLSCLALGISGGGGCRKHIPKHKIQIIRDKGTFNDNLVTLRVSFDAIANIAATVNPCGGTSSGGGDDGCDNPCEAFFGACGCTDPDAINYDENAGTDDGSCCYGTIDNPCVEADGSSFPPEYPDSETSNGTE